MTLQETRAYDDIINLPHHQSQASALYVPPPAGRAVHAVRGPDRTTKSSSNGKNAETTAIAQAEAQGDTDFGA